MEDQSQKLIAMSSREKRVKFGKRFTIDISHENGSVREKMLLGGWDPTDPVPAIAFYPSKATSLPLVILLHGFQRNKEALEPWARQLASKGFFAMAIDLHLHGERKVEGILTPDLFSLGKEYSIFIHQSSVAHSVQDFPFILRSLKDRKEVDPMRIGVTGISMGASTAMVLAWKQKSISAVAALIGACDFWWDVTKIAPGPQQDERRNSYSQRILRLVSSIDPLPRLRRIPPKALFVANGRLDPSIDITSIRRFASKIEKHYTSFPERLCFVEEEVGHQVTDSMRHGVEEWFIRFLKKEEPASQ